MFRERGLVRLDEQHKAAHTKKTTTLKWTKMFSWNSSRRCCGHNRGGWWWWWCFSVGDTFRFRWSRKRYANFCPPPLKTYLVPTYASEVIKYSCALVSSPHLSSTSSTLMGDGGWYYFEDWVPPSTYHFICAIFQEYHRLFSNTVTSPDCIVPYAKYSSFSMLCTRPIGAPLCNIQMQIHPEIVGKWQFDSIVFVRGNFRSLTLEGRARRKGGSCKKFNFPFA